MEKSITVPQDFLKELMGEILPETIEFLEKKYGFAACAEMNFDPSEPFDYPPGSKAFEGYSVTREEEVEEQLMGLVADRTNISRLEPLVELIADMAREGLMYQTDVLQSERLMDPSERADSLGDKVAQVEKAQRAISILQAFVGAYRPDLEGFEGFGK